MSWTIRPAQLHDGETIIEFNSRLARESENKTLDLALLRPGVEAVLADSNKGLYYLAENDQQEIVGQIMITFEWSDWRNGWIWWIQSVYVRVESRRQGVFRALFNHVKKTAEQTSDVIGLRLYVDKENIEAQETYYRLGMEKSSYFVLERYPL